MSPSAPSSLLLGSAAETPAERAARRATAATKKKVAAKKKTSSKRRKKTTKKKLPVCSKKDLRKPKKKRRKCRVVKRKKAATKPSPTGPVAAPPATASSPDAFPAPPTVAGTAVFAPTPGLATFSGPWTVESATRLLSRAGFGPQPGQAEEFARIGLRAAVDRLLHPASADRSGPAPTGTYLVGGELAPADRYGHLHLDALDRAVRGGDQLGERMTLILHDWFAVSESGSERQQMPAHLDLLRRGWRGSFRDLLLAVTQDPAMLLFLDGRSNRKGAPNENYARELQELYALGADRGAYTEDDVRELARALTGFRSDWSASLGNYNFRFDPTRFDSGSKTIYAGTGWQRTGRLTWQDGVNAVVDHPMHPSFVVLKLWSYFVATAPTPETQAALEALYRSSGEQLLPLVEAILVHPDFYTGPTLVKPPVVHAAALMRARGIGLTTDAWVWMCSNAGQVVGFPPNVSGWNDRAWLNTSTHAARWYMVSAITRWSAATSASYAGRTESTAEATETAHAFWGRPALSNDTRAALQAVGSQTWAPRTPGDQYGSMQNFLAQRQNALRVLIGASPDFQVC